jgi:hypothetical protein
VLLSAIVATGRGTENTGAAQYGLDAWPYDAVRRDASQLEDFVRRSGLDGSRREARINRAVAAGFHLKS